MRGMRQREGRSKGTMETRNQTKVGEMQRSLREVGKRRWKGWGAGGGQGHKGKTSC